MSDFKFKVMVLPRNKSTFSGVKLKQYEDQWKRLVGQALWVNDLWQKKPMKRVKLKGGYISACLLKPQDIKARFKVVIDSLVKQNIIESSQSITKEDYYWEQKKRNTTKITVELFRED